MNYILCRVNYQYPLDKKIELIVMFYYDIAADVPKLISFVEKGLEKCACVFIQWLLLLLNCSE